MFIMLQVSDGRSFCMAYIINVIASQSCEFADQKIHLSECAFFYLGTYFFISTYLYQIQWFLNLPTCTILLHLCMCKSSTYLSTQLPQNTINDCVNCLTHPSGVSQRYCSDRRLLFSNRQHQPNLRCISTRVFSQACLQLSCCT